MTAIVEFLKARLDESEAAVRDHLCIHCGQPTVPLRSAFGVTGYSHGGNWQGRRCPGRITGAEPVQNPVWVLADVEGKRLVISMYEGAVISQRAGWISYRNRTQDEAAVDVLGEAVKSLALPYAAHPAYLEEWRP